MRTALVAAIVWTTASVAAAQHSLVEQGLIERGLAAYSAGNMGDAVELFGAAIHADAADPRPRYLRASCLMRMGRSAEARADLLTGAQLEVRQPGAYPVEAALQNVVGADRKLIDAIRYRALIGEPLVVDSTDGGMIGGGNVGSNAGVLRQRVALSLGDLVRPVSLAELLDRAPHTPSQAAAVGSSKSAEPGSPTINAAPADTSSTAPAAEVLPDPFADDPEPSATPDTSDPLSPPAASGSEEPAAESTAGDSSDANLPAESSSEPAIGDDEDPFAG
jgi:hypothetical protein